MTLGDSIALVGCLWGGMWFTAWLLKRIWPSRFGGDLEHWLLLKREELERKHLSLAKARHDEMERQKHRQREHDANWPHNEEYLRSSAHEPADGAFGALRDKERPDYLGHIVGDAPKNNDAWGKHNKPKGKN